MKIFSPIVLIMLAALLSVSCLSTRNDKLPQPPEVEQQGVRSTTPSERSEVSIQHEKKPKADVQPAQSVSGIFRPMVPGRRIARVSVPGKYVALTFDDGPSASYTPKVLDILRRHGVHATFFVLGENAARNKGILARAAAEGHEIASHTWNHANLTKLSRDQIASQMDRTAAVLQEATGRKPSLMRPPYGATNRGIVDYMMTQYGIPSVLWDVDTVDWKHPGVKVVVDRAVRQARNGSIILLHDIHASTLEAVEGVVEGLHERGFKLVTVSELIRMGYRAAGTAPVSSESVTVPFIANTLPPSDEGTNEGTNTPAPDEERPAQPTIPKEPEQSGPATSAPQIQQVVASSPAPVPLLQEMEVPQQQSTLREDSPAGETDAEHPATAEAVDEAKLQIQPDAA